MALIGNRNDVSPTRLGDAAYNARRFGALGLVRLASWVLTTAIGLYQRQLISREIVRIAVSVTGGLEKSALALLLGPKHSQPHDDSKMEQ
jgi:hypothetical protein